MQTGKDPDGNLSGRAVGTRQRSLCYIESSLDTIKTKNKSKKQQISTWYFMCYFSRKCNSQWHILLSKNICISSKRQWVCRIGFQLCLSDLSVYLTPAICLSDSMPIQLHLSFGTFFSSFIILVTPHKWILSVKVMVEVLIPLSRSYCGEYTQWNLYLSM